MHDPTATPAPPPHARPAEHREVGVQLIVAYKWIKAVLEVAGGIVILVLARSGELGPVQEFARALQRHVASRWSVHAGRLLAEIVTARGIHLVVIALTLDGVLSAVEGWSLWARRRWGPWLVVVATATPLPLEIAHVVRTHHLSRAILVLVNLAVVAYLAWRIRARRRR